MNFILTATVVRATERIGGALGKYIKWGNNVDCARGFWGHGPRAFWDFTLFEVCSGDLWIKSCESHVTILWYMHTFKLSSSFSGFRKVWRTGPSNWCSSHVRCALIQLKFVSAEVKKQADLKSIIQQNELHIGKLVWDVNDEWDSLDLVWMSSAQFGGPLTLGAQDNPPMLPLPVGSTDCNHTKSLSCTCNRERF